MRNLKRALSLALAAVMIMGMMVVGGSAKSYTDADKIDNQVAVEILGEIGVMVGNEDGSFAPDRVVTRAEMAVILTRILYGNNLNVDQFKGLNTFTDVPDWAEGFVNLCASLGIVAGRGNGIFDPNATVTTAEAALMLSRALGYFKNSAEFGSDWALASVKRATQAGIIGGDMVLQANAGLTRDDVAQMTFNTLTKAVPVQYNELLNVYYNENQGVIYALEFNYLQTLGYKNFNLVYKNNASTIYGRPATTWGIGSYKDTGDSTASGIEKSDLTSEGGLIASNVRMLDKDQIITVANTPDYVYDNGTDEKVMYDDLGASVCNDAKGQTSSEEYTWAVYKNGEEQDLAEADMIPGKNVTSDYPYTGKGSVTEVYIDDYDQTVTVVEINYYLGQVSKVNDDDDTINVRELSQEAELDDDTFATTAFAEDDYVVFTVDYNDDNDFYICELMAPETVTGDVTRVQNENSSDDTYIRLDNGDTKYYYTAKSHMCYDVSDGSKTHPTLNEEYILYMTPAGYVLGFEPTEEKIDQYLYVKDTDEDLRDWVARVILPDATEPKVDLDEDLNNVTADYPFTVTAGGHGVNVTDAIDGEVQWIVNDGRKVAVDGISTNDVDLANTDYLIWNYSVNSSDVYSLDYVTYETNPTYYTAGTYQSRINGTAEIHNGKAYVTTGTGDAQYFIVDQDTIFVDTMNNVAYTGYDEVPNVEDATLAYVVEDKVAQIVFILDGEIYDKNATFFALTDSDRETGKADETYWEYENAYVDGKKQSMFVTYDAVSDLAKALSDAGKNVSDYLGWGDAKNGDADHWILKAGILYKAVQTTTDGQYVTKLEVIDTNSNYVNGYVSSVGNKAFWLTQDNKTPVQFTTDNDTTYVTVRKLLDVDGQFDKFVIDDGDIDDLKALTDTNATDYSDKYVFVVKDEDDTKARLVYIFWTEKELGNAQDITFTDGANNNTFTLTAMNAYTNVYGNVLTVNDKGRDAQFKVNNTATYKVVSVKLNGVELKADANGVYTIANVTKDMTVSVTTEIIPASSGLTLKFNQDARVTIDGKTYTKNETINLLSGKEYEVEVLYAASVADDLKALELDSFVVPSYGNKYYITMGDDAATLEIGVPMYTLTLPTGVTASWTLGNTSDTTTKVPEGATVTLALASDIGSWSEDGVKFVTSRTMNGNLTVSEDEFGYYELTLTSTFTVNDPADGKVYVKDGSTKTVTMGSGTWDGSGWQTNAKVTGSNFTATVTATTANTVTFEISSITADTNGTVAWN